MQVDIRMKLRGSHHHRQRASERIAAIGRSWLLAVLAVLFAPSVRSQQVLPDVYWIGQNGIYTTPTSYNTQAAALGAWLAANSYWHSSGPCGAIGTSSYRFCPIAGMSGEAATVDVPQLCPLDANPWPTGANATSPDGLGCARYFVTATPDPTTQPQCNNCVGDPIATASGNVTITESDYVAASPGGTLRFARSFNSLGPGVGTLPSGWRHSFSRNVSVDTPAFQPYLLAAVRAT